MNEPTRRYGWRPVQRIEEATPADFFDIDGFLDLVKKGLIDIAEKELGGFISQFFDDSMEFVEAQLGRMYRWTRLLYEGDLDKDEYEFLILGLFDLMEMHALTQLGIAIATIQRIKQAIINLVINSALKVIGL